MKRYTLRIYLAGQITGDRDYKKKFEKAAAVFIKAGHIVLNPAALPKGLTCAEYMRICFAMIDVSDVVVFLPDWETSGGAQLEKTYCDYTRKPYRIMKEEEM